MRSSIICTTALVISLAIAIPAAADTATLVTAAATGTFPSGASFNGVLLEKIDLSSGVDLTGTGTSGRFNARLISYPVLGVRTTILAECSAAGGARVDANTVTVSGACAVDSGGVVVGGVPFVATVVTTPDSKGSVALALGSTSLPAATIAGGSMTARDVEYDPEVMP
jgi:hypothetical protein